MAFRNFVRVDTKHQHKIILSSSSIRCHSTRFMRTKYSIKEEDGDYNSMTVSDLRELLRQRGLAISGIKAQLVERLESGTINPGKIGSRPKMPRNEKKKSNRISNDKDEVNTDRDGENDMGYELFGLVNHLKSLEAGNDTNTNPKRERTMQDLDRQAAPRNLVFAKGGEEESDDEWGDDEDYEEEEEDDDDQDDSDYDGNDSGDYDLDPNKTARAPQIIRSKGGGETASFKEDFQGTRVFVQGLPEKATWKDVSTLSLSLLIVVLSVNFSHQILLHSSAQRSFQAKHCWRSCVCLSQH